MFRSDLFDGHVAVVTGGGSGLGRAIAAHLVRHGARVAILGRRETVLEEAADELGRDKVMPMRCDVRFPDEVDAALDAVSARFGSIDSLVNSAAGNFVSPTERLSANAFKLVVDTVLLGTVHCTLALGKRWISSGRQGSVLCITTNYASTGSPYFGSQARAHALVEELGADDVLAIRADACDPESGARMLERCIACFGRLDALVNNAGVTRDQSILTMGHEDWQAVLTANLDGAFHTCKSAASHFLRRKAGCIVNIASVAGVMGVPGQVNYCASKAGLIGLSRALAMA